jgi:hypothetical protein
MPRTLDHRYDHLHHDEIPLPDFEDHLLAELRTAHRYRTTHEPRPASTSRRVQAARRAHRSLVTAAAVALLAGAAAVVTDTGLVGEHELDQVALGLDMEIIAAIDQALEESVVHTVQRGTDTGAHESWIDERTGAHRFLQLDPDGQPLFETGVADPPGRHEEPVERAPSTDDRFAPDLVPQRMVRTVDHCFGHFLERPEPAIPAHSAARRIRGGLADGSMRVDGTETIDGRPLIRIVTADQPDDRWDEELHGSLSDDGIVTYVDPADHRPVLVRGHAGTDAAYDQTIRYLDRTADNLKDLVPQVPDGYTPVDDLRSDGERLAAGCND